MSAFGPKRTFLLAPHMSALGVKRTCSFALQMSAYDPGCVKTGCFMRFSIVILAQWGIG